MEGVPSMCSDSEVGDDDEVAFSVSQLQSADEDVITADRSLESV